MKILMIMLSGVMLVNSQDMGKERFESITHTKVVEQYKIIPNEMVQQAVAKKATTSAKKATPTKKKTTKKAKSNTKSNTKKKTTKKKITKKQAKKAKRVNYGKSYTYNKGEMQSYARQMVYQYGWTDEDYYSIVMIVNHESSWRPNAVNKKSGSCGLFQAYPCSKMAKYGSDYRTNWKVQMKFGFEYIKARYKTPNKAWAFWQKHHWY